MASSISTTHAPSLGAPLDAFWYTPEPSLLETTPCD